jgi:pimeloyl-ACP methyl ester carboxylesterase
MQPDPSRPAAPVAVPPTSRGFVERPDGARIYYEATGTGPALIFAHGLGGNHLSWVHQVPHFCGRYTCIAFAHRGFAPSSPIEGGPDPADYAGDLAALIDHLKLGEVRLVAQSMGGWTSVEYLLAHPGRVRALVLASTAGTIERSRTLFPDDPERLERWSTEAAATARDLERRGIGVAAGERMAREQPALHFLYRSISGLSRGLDRDLVRRRLWASFKRPLSTLREIDVPTLFITGAEDLVFPAFLADALAPLMPKARVARIEDAGHSVYFERPATFNRLVEDFLAPLG